MKTNKFLDVWSKLSLVIVNVFFRLGIIWGLTVIMTYAVVEYQYSEFWVKILLLGVMIKLIYWDTLLDLKRLFK
jgi:hypothetical protein